ncbi:MAG TPA: glycosyltransferase family 39 protein [Pseudonocardia sp.]|nr:glycosyltransferase family 39 protein [Pseudonocardia sp.]
MTAGVTPGRAVGGLPRTAWLPVGVVLVVQAVVLTALSGRYGFHRDELYFLAAGRHLAWGYVDQPALTPALARLAGDLFGDSPAGLRVVATLCGLGTVLLAALAARELGGGRAAQVFTAAATALSTVVLVVAHMLSTTTVDLVVWTAFAVVMLRLTRTGDPRWWLAAGAVAGVGLQNKWLLPLLCAGWAVALLAVGPRAVLRSGWLVAGLGVAAVLAAPAVVWQATNGWPLLTVASDISGSDGAENRLLFVPLQLVYLSPVLVPVLVAGALRVWRDPGLRWARAAVLVYPVVAVAVLVLGGKAYYAIPPLLVLLAAGAQPAVEWLARGTPGRRRSAAVAAVIGVTMSVLIGLPVLPPAQLGPVLAMNKEAGEQVGWPELVDTVAVAWRVVPPAERAGTVLFTSNYGQAGAIDRYGPERDLPAAHSGHMSYADWGPPPDTMTGSVLVVGAAVARFDGCYPLAVHRSPDGLDNEEDGTVISRCPAPDRWSAVWPELRHGY